MNHQMQYSLWKLIYLKKKTGDIQDLLFFFGRPMCHALQATARARFSASACTKDLIIACHGCKTSVRKGN